MTKNQFSDAIREGQKFLITKQYSHASALSSKILGIEPTNLDALLIQAIALQHQNLPQQALLIVDKIKWQKDDYIPILLIEVQLLQNIGDYETASKLAQTALNLAPGHGNLWHEYSQILYKIGHHTKAEDAFKQYLLHSAEHPLLRDGLEALFEEKLPKAERAVRTFLQQQPNNVSALRLLAEIALKLGILNDAQLLLEKALSIAPDYHLARLNYAHTLNKREKSQQALLQINNLEKAQPDHVPVQLIKAAILVKLNEFESAVSVYHKILKLHAKQPSIWCSLGHAQKTLGWQKESIVSYQKAIELDPNFAEAYWSLANLKTYRFNDIDINNMLLAYNTLSPKDDENIAHVCFALGSAYEKLKQFDKSFEYYAKGNEIKRKIEPYDAKGIDTLVSRNIRCFANTIEQAANQASPSPIFIVGLPRSGSTLLEQILASHSMVDGTRELPNILSIARQLGNKKRKEDEDMYPQSLRQLSIKDLDSLGCSYLTDTAHYRNQAPFFIDKMPNNFLHIGLIKCILPNAKIIDARRNPTSTCFSCFKQLFAVGQTFSNNLSDLEHYYSNYLKMMSFWQGQFSQDILTVHYEKVVTDLENQVRSILDFLGLPFETACIEFHNNERAVATASSEQVRQPINTKGLDAWVPYEKHLTELKSLQKL
jgi:tetratricopeptide (TPR) repeat protein